MPPAWLEVRGGNAIPFETRDDMTATEQGQKQAGARLRFARTETFNMGWRGKQSVTEIFSGRALVARIEGSQVLDGLRGTTMRYQIVDATTKAVLWPDIETFKEAKAKCHELLGERGEP